jgi:hypothetical protein
MSIDPPRESLPPTAPFTAESEEVAADPGRANGSPSVDHAFPADDTATAVKIVSDFVEESESHKKLLREVTQGKSRAKRLRGTVRQKVAESVMRQKSYTASHTQDRHHASLVVQYAIAVLLLPFELFAANFAAQAVGAGLLTTWLLTVLFLALLLFGEFALDAAVRRQAHRATRATLVGLTVFIGILGALRFEYALAVEGRGPLAALLIAALLSLVTAGLVAFGYLALREAESVSTFKARKAWKAAQRAQAAAENAAHDAEVRDAEKTVAFMALIEPRILQEGGRAESARSAIRHYLNSLAPAAEPIL